MITCRSIAGIIRLLNIGRMESDRIFMILEQKQQSVFDLITREISVLFGQEASASILNYTAKGVSRNARRKAVEPCGSEFPDIRPVMGAEIDMAIGSDENDYEIKIRRDQWDDRYKYGNVFYINDTEFGGIIGRKKINTIDSTISLFGRTWRGMLEKKNHSTTHWAGL